MAATTAASLDAEQDSGNILKTQSTTIPNTRSKRVPTPSYDSPLLRGNTMGSDEERLEHQDDLTDFVPPTTHDSRLLGGHTPGSDEVSLDLSRLATTLNRLKRSIQTGIYKCSSSLNANSKVHTCSTECEQSYAQLKKLYDTQREQLGDASIEIQAYTQALKKVEAQLVTHQKNQLWYEEKIRFMKIDLDDKTNVLTYHKKLLAKAVKEKEELKTKLESFETSSKSLNTLLNSQLSANDKAGFGHNGAKESKVSETITSVSKVETSNSETSNDKVEMPKIKTVRMSEPIIEEWESDSEDDEIVVKPKEVTKTVKPSFEKIESVNARNETVRQAENPRKNNKSPRGNKRNWNGMMTQKLGENFEFNNKACYVCGSFDHLHYTCKHKRKINDQKQVKPVWNNSKRVNHQNFGRFSHPNPKSNIVPQAVLTKSGLVSLNTAKSVSTAQSRKTMNDAMPTTYSYYKAYSSVKRPFNKKTTNYNRYFNKRVNTVKSTRVNTARPKVEVNTIKASASWELTFFLGLKAKQKDNGIFISQDKYVVDILKKFDFVTVKTASTPIETNKALLKDKEAENMDVHLYRSMIGSLMCLTASRPDIMFAVCACARFQVTPKVSHLHAVKRIFRYLKGQPKLGLWYPRDSPFDLEAFSDSDYAGASLDRKSTTGGCQFLGKRLISWQCKKQTIVANSTTEAEYVAAANCCGQVLWIQNQMHDYMFNFMNTKIYIDNESTICIVKNPVFHSKTKHIEIRHHFIRDSYEKRLIQVIKIHTDHNVADLLTKAFDVGRFQYLTASIGMLNP
ncbi:hypothetical protein Tco_1405492 [Tanacetum coccineum]